MAKPQSHDGARNLFEKDSVYSREGEVGESGWGSGEGEHLKWFGSGSRSKGTN